MKGQSCWILSDGKRGVEVQSLALAEALGLSPVLKRITLAFPWRFLPPSLCFKSLLSVRKNPDPIRPPWPDILISCGRQAVALAAGIKKESGGKTFAIHIQDPKIKLSKFDLIIAPTHDGLRAQNVINTTGSIHSITLEKLQIEAEKFKYLTEALPKPYIGVMIGGLSRHHDFSETVLRDLIQKIKGIAKKTEGSLLLTPSRRTPSAYLNILKEGLKDVPCYLWEGDEPNPYFGMLGLSDYLIVTCDSVNMATEAAATGKPLYIYYFDKSPKKFQIFHKSLENLKISRPLNESVEFWSYEPLCEVRKVAEQIKDIYKGKR